MWNPNLRPQFTQQYNLTFEYQLTSASTVTLGYVGHNATHLVAPTDWNQPLPGTGPASTWLPLQQRRPLYSVYPLVTQISGTDSWAVSNYNALQAGLRRRYSKGLEFLTLYTLSNTLTDNLGYYGSGGVAAQGASTLATITTGTDTTMVPRSSTPDTTHCLRDARAAVLSEQQRQRGLERPHRRGTRWMECQRHRQLAHRISDYRDRN